MKRSHRNSTRSFKEGHICSNLQNECPSNRRLTRSCSKRYSQSENRNLHLKAAIDTTQSAASETNHQTLLVKGISSAASPTPVAMKGHSGSIASADLVPPLNEENMCASVTPHEELGVRKGILLTPQVTLPLEKDILPLGTDTPPPLIDKPIAPEQRAESSDEDEFPSFSDLLNSCSCKKPFMQGEVIWLKLRKYPPWPSLIIDKKQKKIKVKFINFQNNREGIWVTVNSVNALPYPGDNYSELVKQALRSRYQDSADGAIKLADSFLRQQALGYAHDPAEFFFPTLLAHCDHTEPGKDSSLVSQNSRLTNPTLVTVKDSKSANDNSEDKRQPFTSKEFSDETKLKIRRREDWLKKLLQIIQSPACEKMLMRKVGKNVKPIVQKKLYLGPFAASEVKGSELALYVAKFFQKRTGAAIPTNEVFEKLIPEAIVFAIMKEGHMTRRNALKIFRENVLLPEEQDIVQAQISYYVSGISDSKSGDMDNELAAHEEDIEDNSSAS